MRRNEEGPAPTGRSHHPQTGTTADTTLTPQTPREWAIYAQAAAAFFDHGYQARIDDEATPAPVDSNVRFFGKWFDQALERQEHDEETRRMVAAQQNSEAA